MLPESAGIAALLDQKQHHAAQNGPRAIIPPKTIENPPQPHRAFLGLLAALAVSRRGGPAGSVPRHWVLFGLEVIGDVVAGKGFLNPSNLRPELWPG